MSEKLISSETEDDLGSLINHISERPQMYIGSSNLYIIAAFIEGFAYCNPSFENEIKEFSKWLPLYLKYPRNWAWWSGLEKKYPNSENALKELPKLFQKFRADQNI